MSQDYTRGTVSPDGRWVWDGTNWIPAQPQAQPTAGQVSPDGHYQYGGRQWIARQPQSAPAPQPAPAPQAAQVPQPVVGQMSDDGRHQWDGHQWLDVAQVNAHAQAPGPLTSRKQVRAENDYLRRQLAELGYFERQQLAQQVFALRQQVAGLQAEAAHWRGQIDWARDELDMADIGMTLLGHPLAASVEYQQQLGALRAHMKDPARNGGAVTCDVNWELQGSRAKGHQDGQRDLPTDAAGLQR